MKTPLIGILLVGGKSSRMGSDKANLIYRNNEPEWQRIMTLMQPFCDEVFLSCRESQDFSTKTIYDSGNGPLEAIYTAHVEHPNAALLVIACDLPLLEKSTIEQLIAQREPSSAGTHFISSTDGKPEPLCSIYERSCFPAIKAALEADLYCPRSIIAHNESHLIHLSDPRALKNANTPADQLEIIAYLNDELSEKTIHIRYFAQLKELAQRDEETLKTNSVTPAGLYEELQMLYQFPHKQKQLMVAVNGDFATWETLLVENDEVVFMPPVAGG